VVFGSLFRIEAIATVRVIKAEDGLALARTVGGHDIIVRYRVFTLVAHSSSAITRPEHSLTQTIIIHA